MFFQILGSSADGFHSALFTSSVHFWPLQDLKGQSQRDIGVTNYFCVQVAICSKTHMHWLKWVKSVALQLHYRAPVITEMSRHFASRKHWQLDSLKLPMASMKSGNVLSRTKGSAQISMSIGSWHSKKQTHSYTHQSLVRGAESVQNRRTEGSKGIVILRDMRPFWYICVW